MRAASPKKTAFYKRKTFLWPVGIFAVLVIVTIAAFRLSPWPGVLLIRTAFDRGSAQTLRALQAHPPQEPVTVLADQQYDPANSQALLDVYIPRIDAQNVQKLPVVIWTHGGAWISGDKTNAAPYFKLLADQKFIVVSVNYTLAPSKKYPTQIFELNQAHAHILANAERWHIDPSKIFLAGDSAGAHLSGQMAALVTNPEYQKQLGINMALAPSQLAGTVLFCGIYKLEGLTQAAADVPKILQWGDDQVVRAFSGTTSKDNPLIYQMSPYYHVTKDFPATFISGGNDDPLTNGQSVPLADKLSSLGVPVTRLFYPADHTPKLPHEYQFNLDIADGKNALQQSVDFMRQRSN